MRLSPRKILALIVGLGLLGFLLYISRNRIAIKEFSWKQFGSDVRQARLDLLLFSVIGIYLCYFLRALRWVRFSHYLGPSSLWRVYESTLMGFAAMFLLGRPGEPVRPLLIARREKFSVSSMFGIYVMERVFDVATTIILAGMSLVLLPALLAELRSSGLEVEVSTHGQPRALPPTVDLSAYRILQEATTNVLKHAHARRVHIRIGYSPRNLLLFIRDDGVGLRRGKLGGNGHGLIGMRERVSLFGGRLRTSSPPGGGFVVAARLPITPAG